MEIYLRRENTSSMWTPPGPWSGVPVPEYKRDRRRGNKFTYAFISLSFLTTDASWPPASHYCPQVTATPLAMLSKSQGLHSQTVSQNKFFLSCSAYVKYVTVLRNVINTGTQPDFRLVG